MAYQYPYGDTQQLNLAWFLDEFKALQEAWEQEKQGITGALDAEIARAEAALSGVIEARDQAAASAADALTYRNAAQSASQAAELSKTNAETARRDASNYAVSAAGSAQNASNSAIAAGNSATLAESAKSTAIQQANAAVQASGAASGYAQSAGQQAANAAASATAADGSATAAAGSATTAGEEADRAEAAADEVADSVTQIATNTSDINSLKESINDNLIAPLNIMSLYKTYSFKKVLTSSGQYVELFKNKIVITKNNTLDLSWYDIHFMLPLSQPSIAGDTQSVLEENINNFQPLFFDKIRVIGYSTKTGVIPYGYAILISTIVNGTVSTRSLNSSITNGKINEFTLNSQELSSDKINISLRLRSNGTSDSGTNNAIIIIDFVNTNLNPTSNQALALALSN